MQLTSLAAKLQSLGLTDKQARIYVATLFLGAASAQRIAGQAEVNRATAYVILDELIELGLVSQSTENRKTVFIGEGAEAIERWLDRQEQDLAAKRTELKEVARELEASERATSGEAPQVRFFRGRDGVAQMSGYFRRKAAPGTVIYSLSNTNEVQRLIPDIITSNAAKRQKKSLSSRLFYSFEGGQLPDGTKVGREQIKLDKPIAADINLYENGAIMSTYGQKDSLGVVIESPEIVAALRQLFELAWDKQAKKRQ